MGKPTGSIKLFREYSPGLYQFLVDLMTQEHKKNGGKKKIPDFFDYNRIYKLMIANTTPENAPEMFEKINQYNQFLLSKTLHKIIFDPQLLGNDFIELLLRDHRKRSEAVPVDFTIDLLNRAYTYMKKSQEVNENETLTIYYNHNMEQITNPDKDEFLLSEIDYFYPKNAAVLDRWLTQESPQISLGVGPLHSLFKTMLKDLAERKCLKNEEVMAPKRAMMIQMLERRKKSIQYMIDIGNFEFIFSFIRVFAKYDQNELVQHFFELFPYILIYDNAFDVISQRKSISLDFIKPLLEGFRENQYRDFPSYQIEADSVMFLINKGNDDLTIHFVNMVQAVNYLSYLNFAIEKRQFGTIEYLMKSIVFFDYGSLLRTPFFKERIAYTTLFYGEEGYTRLRAIFAKVGIEDSTPTKDVFNLVTITQEMIDAGDKDLSCQICIEDGNVGESLLSCKKCHKLFHCGCIYRLIESKSPATILQGEEIEGNGEYADIFLEGEEEDAEDAEDEADEAGEADEADEADDADEEKKEETKEEEWEDAEEASAASSSDDGEDDDSDEDSQEYAKKVLDEKICIISEHYTRMKCVHCQCLFSI